MQKPPAKIYLQFHGDADPALETGEVSLKEVSWSTHQIFAHDIEYYRADVHEVREKIIALSRLIVHGGDDTVLWDKLMKLRALVVKLEELEKTQDSNE